MAEISLDLAFYGRPGAGWNRGYIIVSNPYSSTYTIELGYTSGPSDKIRYGYSSSQMDIVRGTIRSIGDVLGKTTVRWDPVFFEFPEEGRYEITFYARPKESMSEEERVVLGTYTVAVGKKPEIPLDIESVTIKRCVPSNGIYLVDVYVSFTKLAPVDTTVYLRYYINDKVVGGDEITLGHNAYAVMKKIRVKKRTRTALFKVCASLDKEKWKCSREINVGTEALPEEEKGIPWKLILGIGVASALIGWATSKK